MTVSPVMGPPLAPVCAVTAAASALYWVTKSCKSEESWLGSLASVSVTGEWSCA